MPENSSFELNFQTFHFAKASALFIPSGQYIQGDQASKSFTVASQASLEHRFLFSQVLSLGHVDADEKMQASDFQNVLNHSSKKWKKLNPFNSTDEELDLLFNTNDWLNQNLEASLDIKHTMLPYRQVQRLSKEKLHLTFFQWKNHKLIKYAHRRLFETGGSVKSTSYDLGFKDISYFCRFFRNNTNQSPGEFIAALEENPKGKRLAEDFKFLLYEQVNNHHEVGYYADRLSYTPKTLSNIIKSATGATPKQHIKNELIRRAQSLLKEGHTISSLAFKLGFQEVSHFSNFFTRHAGQSPSQIQPKSTII